GTTGEIYRLQHGAWFGTATPVNLTIRAITVVAGTVWVAGDHGAVFARDGNSGQWMQLSIPADIQLNAIGAAPDGTVWVGGNASGPDIYQRTATGNWQTVAIAG